jgi:hypothetical protein
MRRVNDDSFSIALSWSVLLPIILWSLLNDRQMTQTSDWKILKAAAAQ